MEDDLAGQRTHKTSFAARRTNHSANSMCNSQELDSQSRIGMLYRHLTDEKQKIATGCELRL